MKCKYCDKPINFVTARGDRVKIPVEATPVYIEPNAPGAKEEFYTARGDLIKGEVRADGLKAYRKHTC